MKIESSLQEKQYTKSLKFLKEQALITNSHLRESQLDYLSQVDKLHSYMNQGKVLLSDLSQQRKLHEEVGVALQQVIHFQKANLFIKYSNL